MRHRNALDPAFEPDQLVAAIVDGARANDQVRVHGAVFAALELHPRSTAIADVFVPALARLRDRTEGEHAAGRVILDHLLYGLGDDWTAALAAVAAAQTG